MKLCLHCQKFPVYAKGYCKYHQKYRTPKTTTRSDRGLYKRQNEPKGDADLFERDKLFYLTIWDTREHRCFNCNCSLSSEPLTLYFHHILPKRNYPDLRHTDWNIVILCSDCHSQVETMIEKTPKVKELTFQTLKRYEDERDFNKRA